MRVDRAWAAFLLVAISLAGCQRAPLPPPPAAPTPAASTPTPAAVAPTPSEPPTATPPATPETPAETPPETPVVAAPSAPGVDTTYVKEDDIGAIIVRPARILSSKFITGLETEGISINDPLINFELMMGVAARNIEEVVVPVDKATADIAKNGFVGFPMRTFIVRTREPTDQAAVVKALTGGQGEEHEEQGQKYFSLESGLAVFFPNEKTFVVTPKDDVAKILAAKKNKNTPLMTRLAATSPDVDIVLLFDISAEKEFLNQFVSSASENSPPELAGVKDLPEQLKFWTITMDINGGSLMGISLEGHDANAAEKTEKLVNMVVSYGKNFYNIEADQFKQVPKEILEVSREVIDAVTVTREDDTVTVAIKPPKNFDELPGIIGPAVLKARADAKKEMAANTQQMQMEITALAFREFQKTHHEFPAAGKEGAAGAGLSWRVHILQELGWDELYSKFKLDEPWDSETNKALIEEMPAIYGNLGPELKGKTVVHVLIGEKTPFGDGSTKPKIADITDSASDMILLVAAGKDKAVEWTKPGGLPFNAEDPLAELGESPEEGFMIAMMDGSIRLMTKDHAVKVLKLLLQPADDEAIEK